MIAITTGTTETMIANTMIVIMNSIGTATDTERDLPGTWTTKEKNDAVAASAAGNAAGNEGAIDPETGLETVEVRADVVMRTGDENEIDVHRMTTSGNATANAAVAAVVSVRGRKRARSEKAKSYCPRRS